MASKISYPSPFRDETVEEVIHGVKIKDPYRWLEDPFSKETKEFIEQQNKLSQSFLDDSTARKVIGDKLRKLWDYPKYSCPVHHGNFYFSFKNPGLLNQSVLYKQTSLDSEPKIFFDPNQLSKDGTIALSGYRFSEDGKVFAYGLSKNGSDWVTIKLKCTETDKDFDDVLNHVKFMNVAWTKDNKGFFYAQFPVPAEGADGNHKAGTETAVNENQKLYYHKIGQDQKEDVFVIGFDDHPHWRISPEVSDCGNYLLLFIMESCSGNRLNVAKINKDQPYTNLKFTEVVTIFDDDYDYITNESNIFTFRTNKGAPNYQIINIDIDDLQNTKTLIAEHPKHVLDWVRCVHSDKLVAAYMEDVKSAFRAYSLKTGEKLFDFPLPIGTLTGFSGDKKYSEIFYHFSSHLEPGTVYKFDFNKVNEPASVHVSTNLKDINHNDFKIVQVFYKSRDGEDIPMFLIEKNNCIEQRKPKPVLLYGYGGYNISIQPFFSVSGLVFIDIFDGILCYPNIRGGGEYGKKWHDGGRLLNKQNTFNDFQDAASYLVEKGYTTSKKIAIQGGSNGGLLVGACINQAPHLFGAATIQVGVLDMLRFHKFTVGKAWISDYGDINEDPHFKNLFKISPLHNVKSPKSTDEQYPSTLILTADFDDRVSPLHSLKFAAELQYVIRDNPKQVNPVLLRVYNNAGHGGGKPTEKKIEEATDILTFYYKQLGLTLN